MNVIQDKINEAKQHLEVLEELRDEKSAWLHFYEEHGKGTIYDEAKYDEARTLTNALDFAIDFIKWGMKHQ